MNNVHPYKLNSNAYNFFFHPLHESEQYPLRAIIAVITNIAITIFTFGLWQIPFWIVNRLDHKKIVKWDIDPVANVTLEVKSKVPLHKVGGFNRGILDNTCYIAATLQSIRQIPLIRKRLSPEYKLTLAPNESNEAFVLRQKIQQTLFDLLNQTDVGITVDRMDFRQFNVLLDDCQQQYVKDGFEKYRTDRYFKPGKAGDQETLFRFLMLILELKNDWEEINYRKKVKWPGEYNNIENDDQLADLLQYNIESKVAPKVILIERIHPPQVKRAQKDPKHPQANVSLKLTKDVPIKIKYNQHDGDGNVKSSHTYTLVSATAGNESHAVACLKEIGKSDGWVYCNDGNVQKVKEIPSFEAVHYLYYAELD